MTVINDYIAKRISQRKPTFVLCGGRRSGKTYAVLNFLLAKCRAYPSNIVNIASMTAEQGRLGAYADCNNIIKANPSVYSNCIVLRSPREVRFANGSVMFFNSYADSETAKGIACDDLFINEANNFSLQQYTDLRANVREFTFLDYNPNIRFWVDEIFSTEDICKTTWKDNPFLTPSQLEYFADLKKLAERPEATSVDKRNYSVYYLGEYAEIDGAIFTRSNIRTAPELPRRENGDLALRNFAIFADPSALRGADYFATCLTATDDDGNVWLIDSDSRNTGGREDVARWMMDTCKAWDVKKCFIETNGLVGIDFYEFAQNSGLPVEGWYSRGNKYQRIVDNYQNLTTQLVVLDTPENRAFLEQVYTFAEKCEHDDNVDALNSSYNMQRWTA